MIDRAKFFAGIRNGPFPGHLTDDQVRGTGALLDAIEAHPVTDIRWIAYMLATAYHETAHTMLPIAEYGHGGGHPYGREINGHRYYGRGYVQLTWDYNYKKMGEIVGAVLLSNPDLAMQPDIAAKIMLEGMIRGTFTGKKLADYFHDGVTDYAGARHIINGTDRAALIAGYAQQFHDDLTAATKA